MRIGGVTFDLLRLAQNTSKLFIISSLAVGMKLRPLLNKDSSAADSSILERL